MRLRRSAPILASVSLTLSQSKTLSDHLMGPRSCLFGVNFHTLLLRGRQVLPVTYKVDLPTDIPCGVMYNEHLTT